MKRILTNLLLLFCAALVTAPAQNATGVVPYSSYASHQYDAFNLSNMNLILTAPVQHKPGPIPFDAQLVSNSSDVGFWQGDFRFFVSGLGSLTWNSIASHCPVPNQATATTKYQGFKYTDATGALYDFGTVKLDSANCYDSTDTQTMTDGTGLVGKATQNPDGTLASFKVTEPSGNSTIGTTYNDLNGNNIHRASGPGVSTDYFDSMGQLAANASLTVRPAANTFTYTDARGIVQTVTENYSAFTQQTNFGCPAPWTEINTSTYLPTSVTFADGTALVLGYEHASGTAAGSVTGRVNSLTLPTGGTISFAYSGTNNGVNCDDMSPATVTRTENGKTTTYAHTVVGQGSSAPGSTVVTLPDGGTATSSFTGTRLNSEIVKDSASNVISTKTISYTGAPIRTVDTYLYKGTSSVLAGSVHTQVNLDTILYAVPVSRKVFLPANSGTAYATTTNVFGSYSGGSCNTVGLPADRVCTATTTDSSGTAGATRYTYDSHGNPLTSSSLANGTTYLSNGSVTYNTNGTVATSTDGFGTLTTNTVTSCNNTLPTTSTTNGLTTTFHWDSTCAVSTGVDTPNGNMSVQYNDPLNRATQKTDMNGAVMNTSFAPTTSESTMSVGPSTTDGFTTVDAFGNPFNTQAFNGSTWDTVSYTYQGAHKTADSLPCATSKGSTCTSPKFTYTYDSVGRLQTKTDATTSATTTLTYVANDVLVTVSGSGTLPQHKAQKEFDGLGRLVSVCEITTATGSAPCGQTNSANGFLTTYHYNSMGLLDTITQFANGSSQTRSFTFDKLGRTLTENTPEGGLVQVFYDSAPSSPGVACAGTYNRKLVKRYDARGNTNCYTYDANGRVASVTYPGSTTLGKYFVFGPVIVNGQAMAHVNGRLSEAYTAASVGGTKITDLGFSYSTGGQTTDVYESTPNSGGYYHTSASYYENGVVSNLSSGVTSKPTWQYGVDAMGRINGLWEFNNCTGPCSLLATSVTYNIGRVSAINYSSGDSDTFNYSSTTGRETDFTLTKGAKYVKSALSWFPNGLLLQQVFTDTLTPANAHTCIYGYDDLARLTSANCGALWNQTFSFDTFGNLTKAATVGTTFNATYNNKNQIANVGGTVPTYDSSGNLLTINTGTLHTYTWDAANRIASIDGKNLTYDALDRVVQEGTTLELLYGPIGKMGVMNGQAVTRLYLPLPKGARVAYDGGVQFLHPDLMGNTILETTLTQGKTYDRFFAPFGEIYNNAGTGVASFTGQTQDLDANLYDFAAREQSPVQGRWLNPDPSGLAGSQLTDPQTLNRYSYVRNSVMALTDATGLRPVYGVAAWAAGAVVSGGAGGQGSLMSNEMTLEQASYEQAQQAASAMVWFQEASPFEDVEETKPESENLEDENPLEPIDPEEERGPYAYDWIHPGPLSAQIAANFAGGRYSPATIGKDGWSSDTALFRVFGGASGETGKNGTFYSMEPQVGGLQSAIDMAINPNWGAAGMGGSPDSNGLSLANVVCVYLPPGTQVYVGPIASQGGAWVGGGIQIYLPPHP